MLPERMDAMSGRNMVHWSVKLLTIVDKERADSSLELETFPKVIRLVAVLPSYTDHQQLGRDLRRAGDCNDCSRRK